MNTRIMRAVGRAGAFGAVLHRAETPAEMQAQLKALQAEIARIQAIQAAGGPEAMKQAERAAQMKAARGGRLDALKGAAGAFGDAAMAPVRQYMDSALNSAVGEDIPASAAPDDLSIKLGSLERQAGLLGRKLRQTMEEKTARALSRQEDMRQSEAQRVGGEGLAELMRSEAERLAGEQSSARAASDDAAGAKQAGRDAELTNRNTEQAQAYAQRLLDKAGAGISGALSKNREIGGRIVARDKARAQSGDARARLAELLSNLRPYAAQAAMVPGGAAIGSLLAGRGRRKTGALVGGSAGLAAALATELYKNHGTPA